MGFPGQGLDAARARLQRRPRRASSGECRRQQGQRRSRGRLRHLRRSARAVCRLLVCNVSSPNTPGLRSLQGRTQLGDLLRRVQDSIAAHPVPLLVKIAPDATDDDLDDIVAVCRELEVDGIIVGNTTLSRPPSLRSARGGETGGLSERR
jgi:dihydroorotate dehydrogenase